MTASRQLQIRDAAASAMAGLSLDGGILKNREFTLATDKLAQLHVNFSNTAPEDKVIYAAHPRDWMTEIELVVLGAQERHDGSHGCRRRDLGGGLPGADGRPDAGRPGHRAAARSGLRERGRGRHQRLPPHVDASRRATAPATTP
jgi:hypothetical protein